MFSTLLSQLKGKESTDLYQLTFLLLAGIHFGSSGNQGQSSSKDTYKDMDETQSQGKSNLGMLSGSRGSGHTGRSGTGYPRDQKQHVQSTYQQQPKHHGQSTSQQELRHHVQSTYQQEEHFQTDPTDVDIPSENIQQGSRGHAGRSGTGYSRGQKHHDQSTYHQQAKHHGQSTSQQELKQHVQYQQEKHFQQAGPSTVDIPSENIQQVSPGNDDDDDDTSATVEVSHILSKTSEDTVVMYFESRRSGGGPVLDIKMNQGSALVTFEDPAGKSEVQISIEKANKHLYIILGFKSEK